ncbi:TonB-dependent siderophore receptor [Halomicronema hongdechloris C2206]|uniref:TonB-dependent siderophore receptor n=1 Tax=Halomicronema hongdechloris C2206 TaxID=1641165 RepID=A0A1Z3HIY9_9CYAN|nr:AMIN domain-containing protein [Halomicronema hongdechloris]ASC70077.1 TonB-dependent siderophore receptor [Halomicronema hongdechloris C2206]
MKRLIGFESWLMGGALIALAAHPAHAATTIITGVQLTETENGVRIALQTNGGDDAEVFTVSQGNTLRADIIRSQLQLPDGNAFNQVNPAPGIESISLTALDANSVRLTIEGTTRVPVAEIDTATSEAMVFSVDTNAVAQTPTQVPSELQTVPSDTPPETSQQVAQAEPDTPEAPSETPPESADPGPQPTEATPDILVPDPEITIDGAPAQQPQLQQAPPFQPRAVAPPVGDIAVAEATPRFDAIDLGSNERIPRLVLRNAPSREVLSLLARSVGVNVVFIDLESESGEGPGITLDIENESVQDVFNHVLRVSGLKANRVGRTVYAGPELPPSAQNLMVRTVRLNQVDADVAANFLVALGAESQVSRERQVTSVSAVEVGEGIEPITSTETTVVEQLENQRIDYEDSQPILRGLQVIADLRTNSLTLVGSPQLLNIATEQLTRIDLRRRQVAVNVRVIDIDLNAIDAFGTSFSFSVDDTSVTNTGGIGVINFGANSPSTGRTTVPGTVPFLPVGPGGGGLFSIASTFLAQLTATVQNGNAKILTDPTLIVQEGQTATVALTETVVERVTQSVVAIGDDSVVVLEPETTEAGLVLSIEIDKIDDNGFVSLSVAPSISSPIEIFNTGGNTFVTLLSERQLESGVVRVRDGQTLLLSGIIRESDRSTVTKVPILGDLPLLGALFRSTRRESERSELIVLLTPQILDDSDQSAFGYNYTPSEDVQELLDRYQQR